MKKKTQDVDFIFNQETLQSHVTGGEWVVKETSSEDRLEMELEAIYMASETVATAQDERVTVMLDALDNIL